ncbi:MAG TPA: GFA family protein [Sphingobium sp.]
MEGQLPLTGGCNCGKVRYELQAQPYVVAACHCVNCRKQSGAAYSVNLVMATKAVAITGDLAQYEDHGEDSGQPVVREFCGTCGSPIRSVMQANPKIVAIKAGTLDDPNPFPPTVHTWTCSAVSWANIPADALAFDKGPPAK